MLEVQLWVGGAGEGDTERKWVCGVPQPPARTCDSEGAASQMSGGKEVKGPPRGEGTPSARLKVEEAWQGGRAGLRGVSRGRACAR